jgi:hypothetical protein
MLKFIQWYSPPTCSEYNISVVYDICGIASTIYCGRGFVLYEDTVIYAIIVPNQITGLQLSAEIQTGWTHPWYVISVPKLVKLTAVVSIRYICDFVTNLWLTYLFSGSRWFSGCRFLGCNRLVGWTCKADTFICANLITQQKTYHPKSPR